MLTVLLHTLSDNSVHQGAGWEIWVYLIMILALVVLLVAMVRDRRRIVGLMKNCLTPFETRPSFPGTT